MQLGRPRHILLELQVCRLICKLAYNVELLIVAAFTLLGISEIFTHLNLTVNHELFVKRGVKVHGLLKLKDSFFALPQTIH